MSNNEKEKLNDKKSGIFKSAFKNALFEIKLNKIQALISAAGFLIAAASMIAVIIATHSMIISEGYRTNPLGANTITLTVNEEKSKVKIDGLRSSILEYDDFIDVVPTETVSNIEMFGNLSTSSYYNVLATDYSFFNHSALTIDKGRFFSTADVTARTHVAVIGSDIAKSLYGDSDPIGQDLKINNQIFSVVGIFDSESKSSLNETVIIPYKSARLILNSTDVGTYTFVCKDGFESDRAVNQAESYMGKVFSDNSKYSIKSNYNSGMVSVIRLIVLIVFLIMLIISCFSLAMFAAYPSRTIKTDLDQTNKKNGSAYVFLKLEYICLLISIAGTLVGLAAGIGAGCLYCLLTGNPLYFNGGLLFMTVFLFLLSLVFGLLSGLVPGILASRKFKRGKIK